MLATRSSLPLKRGRNLLPRLSRYPGAWRGYATSGANPTSNSSVDANEVTHFDALASTWWDPQGPSRLLHLMNPLRHDFITSCISSHTPQPIPSNTLTYLDIGCGGGIFAESAARLATTKSVTAIDPSGPVIAVAAAHAKRDPYLHQPSSSDARPSSQAPPARLTYLNTDIESLSPSTKHTSNHHHQQQQYDIVTLFEVIEHVSHPSDFLTSCLPYVKPGGWLILSTIARTWTSWFTTKLVAEDLAGLVPRGTHDWRKYIQDAELRAWFAKQQQQQQQTTNNESKTRDGAGKWVTAETARGELDMRSQGMFYVPGVGWKTIDGGEKWGNYFFGVRRKPLAAGEQGGSF